MYVTDRKTGRRQQVDVPYFGAVRWDRMFTVTGIGLAGRHVLFRRRCDKIKPGDSKQIDNVFVRDLRRAKTWRLDATEPGASTSARAFRAEGRHLVFQDGKGMSVHDLETRRTRPVKAPVSGRHGAPAPDSQARRIAFSSWEPALVSGDTKDPEDMLLMCRCWSPSPRASGPGSPSTYVWEAAASLRGGHVDLPEAGGPKPPRPRFRRYGHVGVAQFQHCARHTGAAVGDGEETAGAQYATGLREQGVLLFRGRHMVHHGEPHDSVDAALGERHRRPVAVRAFVALPVRLVKVLREVRVNLPDAQTAGQAPFRNAVGGAVVGADLQGGGAGFHSVQGSPAQAPF
ncbi:hypothetical protein [Streptomyces rimosus]|uniref:hypothetical protein n=1 Tax=Streptomyces rimosus TaxID=1927 RepID=UPI00311E3968